MILRRTPLVAALAATAALAVGAPGAGATTVPALPTSFAGSSGLAIGALPTAPGGAAAGSCGSANGSVLQGHIGETSPHVCGGLAFIGPSIGQIATVIGPTIISPAVSGAAIVTGNNVTFGP